MKPMYTFALGLILGLSLFIVCPTMNTKGLFVYVKAPHTSKKVFGATIHTFKTGEVLVVPL